MLHPKKFTITAEHAESAENFFVGISIGGHQIRPYRGRTPGLPLLGEKLRVGW